MSVARNDEHLAELRFFESALERLLEARIPFLVGGAYAFERYTGIERHTRDLDLFVAPEDAPAVLRLFENAGHRTSMPFPHWLAKIHEGPATIDVIFSSGNGIARVDDLWFRHAVPAEVLGLPIRLVPVEEMIWSKAFVMERERFDGADVIHLLAAYSRQLDWPRLAERFRHHPHVLYAHLLLFSYTYPGLASQLPSRLIKNLNRAVEDDRVRGRKAPRLCRGTFLSRSQYLADLSRGFEDARLQPFGNLDHAELLPWTRAAFREPGTGLPGSPLKPSA